MSRWKNIVGRFTGTSSAVSPHADVRVDASTHSLQTITYEHHEIHGGSHYFYEGHETLANAGSYRLKLVTPNTDKLGHMTWTVTSNGITSINFWENSAGGMAAGNRCHIRANHRSNAKNCWSATHTVAGSHATIMEDAGAAWEVDALIGMQIYNVTDVSAAFITDNDADTVTVAALLGGTDNDWDQNDVYEINNSQMVMEKGVAVPTTYGCSISNTSFGGTGFKADVGGGTDRNGEIALRKNTTYLTEILSGSDSNIVTFGFNWYEHTDKD